jgi:hypothetical protein
MAVLNFYIDRRWSEMETKINFILHLKAYWVFLLSQV